MFEFLYLNASESLHHHDCVLVDRCYGLDEINLIARKLKGKTASLFSGSILVGTDKYDSHVRILGSFKYGRVNLVIFCCLVHKIESLKTVVAKSVDLGLHRGAGAIYAAYSLSGCLGGLKSTDEVSVRRAHMRLDDTALGRDVHTNRDFIYIDEINVIVCCP